MQYGRNKVLVVCALVACLSLIACTQQTHIAASNETNSSPSGRAAEDKPNAAFVSEPNDFPHEEQLEKENSALNEAEQQALEQHVAAWRERFPLDNYANTLLIGDSLMLNASEALQEALPGVTVDADAGRSLEQGGLVFEDQSPSDGVLDHVRRDTGAYERYVIGTGNNDPGGMSQHAAQEIVDCLGPNKEIYFVTMCMPENLYGVDVTNKAINLMVKKYGNVHKIDWYGLVSGHEEEYLSDGVHVIPGRESDYAACIKAGLEVVY